MNKIKREILIFLVFLFLIQSCTIFRKTQPPLPPEEEKVKEGLQQKLLSDKELFNLGLSYLSSTDLNPDYSNALLAFKQLCENYPESKWKDIAQHLANLLEKYLKLSLENSRLSLENQELTKEKKLLQEEKIQWELERETLQKEIATLKSDLECLKQIEIETERRKKNIR